MRTHTIANRWMWMIAAVAMTGACVDDGEPLAVDGDPDGALHAQHLRALEGLDEAELLAMLDEHAGEPGAPIMLSGDDAVAFQHAQAGLAAASAPRIFCSAYFFPLPPPWVANTKLTSCVHSDHWTSMNLESPAILSNHFDLASLSAIDLDRGLAAWPAIRAVPAQRNMSLVFDASWMHVFTHHYRGSASVRPRGSQTFLWPLLSPPQGW